MADVIVTHLPYKKGETPQSHVLGLPADRLRAILDAVGDAPADEVREAIRANRERISREAMRLSREFDADDERDALRESLAWAIERVGLTGCMCREGGTGTCVCDYEARPDRIALRKARALLAARIEEGTDG